MKLANRSMNASLWEGSTDGTYKKIRPDAECSVDVDGRRQSTYGKRSSLSLLYYGMGEKRHMNVPAGPDCVQMPDYYPNRLQDEADHGPVLGRAW